MVAKTIENYVLPTLNDCITITTSFDLWMSQIGFNTFALVVNFIHKEWL
jgi:hypothetical protein